MHPHPIFIKAVQLANILNDFLFQCCLLHAVFGDYRNMQMIDILISGAIVAVMLIFIPYRQIVSAWHKFSPN
ncbi:hypothetical protein D3C72_1399860 [compost metagenome]